MLLVQLMQCEGHLLANVGHLFERQGGFVQRRAQRFAGNVLHHDVGLTNKVALGHKAWHMRALERRHHHLLDFEANDRGRVFAALDARDLHDQGFGGSAIFALHVPQGGHAALVQLGLQYETVDHHALLQARRRGRFRLVSVHL